MTQLHDKVVAITGAASGIGRGLAKAIAAKGAALALSDVNEAGLDETVALIAGQRSPGPAAKVTTHIVNVARRDDVYRYAEDVERQHGGADIIINNAGLAIRASIEEFTYEDFETVIGVNMWGVIYGTKAFMPLLRKRPEGHIVNISSINAMIPFLYNGPYNISKYAVLALCETLTLELKGEPIHVTCVHPGGIRTNIARTAKNVTSEQAAMFERTAMTSPDGAANVIISGIERNKEQVFIGADAKVMALGKRIAPHFIVHGMGNIMRRMYEK